MNFWRQVKKSIYGPEFYRAAVVAGTTRPWRYFFKLIAGLALLMAILGAVSFTPPLKKLITFGAEWVNRSFPADLTLTIKDGVAAIQPEQRYELELLPTSPSLPIQTGIKFALVIDPNLQASDLAVADFSSQRTFLLLTKEAAIYALPGGGMKVVPLSEVPNFSLNRLKLDSWLDKIQRILPLLWLLIGLIIFITTFVFAALTLLWLLILALVLQLLSNFRKLPLTYVQAYHALLHASTAGFILQLLLFLSGWGGNLYALPVLLILITAAGNLQLFTKKETR